MATTFPPHTAHLDAEELPPARRGEAVWRDIRARIVSAGDPSSLGARKTRGFPNSSNDEDGRNGIAGYAQDRLPETRARMTGFGYDAHAVEDDLGQGSRRIVVSCSLRTRRAGVHYEHVLPRRPRGSSSGAIRRCPDDLGPDRLASLSRPSRTERGSSNSTIRPAPEALGLDQLSPVWDYHDARTATDRNLRNPGAPALAPMSTGRTTWFSGTIIAVTDVLALRPDVVPRDGLR